MSYQKKKVHFIAIGGIGMSALANILLSMGVTVSGSDVKESGVIEKLREQGATIYLGHKAEHIPEDCDEIIYSSAIKKDNPELLCAKERKIPITHRGTLLARLFNPERGLAVAGAHGKTTTSGMLGQILHDLEYHPNIVIGGILPDIGSNAIKDDSDLWVVEADESDRSFLKLKPYITVVTNIEPEHMEHYENSEAVLKQSFTDFCNGSEKVIACLDDVRVGQISAGFIKPYYTYGIRHQAVDLTARNITHTGMTSDSSVYYKGEKVARLHLAIPGEHNVENALGAMYAAYLIGVPFEDSAKALAQFQGTGRRFDVRYHENDIMVVDDYAHHPTEVKATIAAAKDCGFRRVIAVFQPHRYSRVRDLYLEFGAAFGQADCIVIDEIYSAWEKRIPDISSQMIVDEIAAKGLEPVYAREKEDIIDYLKTHVQNGDLVLMMGAGDICNTTESFCQWLRGEH